MSDFSVQSQAYLLKNEGGSTTGGPLLKQKNFLVWILSAASVTFLFGITLTLIITLPIIFSGRRNRVGDLCPPTAEELQRINTRHALQNLRQAIGSNKVLSLHNEGEDHAIVSQPQSSEFKKAIELYNPQFDSETPGVVIMCENEQDIVHGMKFANETQWKVTVKSGGHSTLGWSTCSGNCVLLNLSRFNQTRIFPQNNTMLAGTAVTQRQAADELSKHSLSANLASGGSIAMGGLIHGGGLGISTRLHSVLADTVLGFKAVLTDGRVVWCDANSEEFSDLFWAVRGGGGGDYAVVTEFLLSVFPAGPTCSFSFTWQKTGNISDMNTYHSGYFKWLKNHASDNVQPFLTYRPNGNLWLHGFYHGPESDLRQELNQLKVVSSGGVIDSVKESTFHDIYTGWIGKSDPKLYLSLMTIMSGPDGFPNNILPTIFEYASQIPSICTEEMYCSFNMLSLGGKSARYDKQFSSWPHRDLLTDIIIDVEGPIAENYFKAKKWSDDAYIEIRKLMPQHRKLYVNSPLPEHLLPDWRSSYFSELYPQLVDVKRKYDPNHILHHPQSVGI